MTTPRSRRVIAAATAVLMAAVLVVQAAAAPNPFKGAWYSQDSDTSNQMLRIAGGPAGSYRVRYYDDGASVCGWTQTGGGPAASARGVLTGPGFEISGDLPVYCLTSPRYLFATVTFTYTYDPGTDTLTDGFGTEWHR